MEVFCVIVCLKIFFLVFGLITRKMMKEADRGMLWLCIENIVPSMTCGISLTCAMNYLTLGHFLKEKTYCIQIYATNTTLKKKKND